MWRCPDPIFRQGRRAHGDKTSYICTDIAYEKKIAGLPYICILTLSMKFNLTEFLYKPTPESVQHIKGKEN